MLGWGGFIAKYDSYGRYSETLTKQYVQSLVPDLASKGYKLIRYESIPSFLNPGEGSKIHYPVLDLLISLSLQYGMTVVIDPIHDFPPEEESPILQSHYSSWLSVLKEVGWRYNSKTNVILECINEYVLSDAYSKFQSLIYDLRNAGVKLPLHFNYMWNSVGELKSLSDPSNKVSVGHHVYGNYDDDWRLPYSGESWLSYCKRIGLESRMIKMFETASEKVWFGYPLSQGRTVMITEVGASIHFKYSPYNVAFVMRFLEYAKKHGVGVAVFRTGYLSDMGIYEQKAKEYFGRSFYAGSSSSSSPSSIISSTSTSFSDDFESGSSNAWSSAYKTSGESVQVSSTAKNSGLYGAQFTTNGGGGYEYAFTMKTISATSEIYLRSYVKVVSNGLYDNGDVLHLIRLRTGSEDVLSAGWRRTSSGIRWNLWIRDGSGYSYAYSSSAPVTNEWYNVEVYWLKSGSSGKGVLYVNGSPVITITGKNTANYGDVTQVSFGIAEAINAAYTKVYGDTVKVSTEYIGPV
jgi:hypothetical protein